MVVGKKWAHYKEWMPHVLSPQLAERVRKNIQPLDNPVFSRPLDKTITHSHKHGTLSIDNDEEFHTRPGALAPTPRIILTCGRTQCIFVSKNTSRIDKAYFSANDRIIIIEFVDSRTTEQLTVFLDSSSLEEIHFNFMNTLSILPSIHTGESSSETLSTPAFISCDNRFIGMIRPGESFVYIRDLRLKKQYELPSSSSSSPTIYHTTEYSNLWFIKTDKQLFIFDNALQILVARYSYTPESLKSIGFADPKTLEEIKVIQENTTHEQRNLALIIWDGAKTRLLLLKNPPTACIPLDGLLLQLDNAERSDDKDSHLLDDCLWLYHQFRILQNSPEFTQFARCFPSLAGNYESMGYLRWKISDMLKYQYATNPQEEFIDINHIVNDIRATYPSFALLDSPTQQYFLDSIKLYSKDDFISNRSLTSMALKKCHCPTSVVNFAKRLHPYRLTIAFVLLAMFTKLVIDPNSELRFANQFWVTIFFMFPIWFANMAGA